ncbi:MAG: hypothetical protein JWR26_655 [Pedosphaera sp.]|nr:hypothetical protein [Pedosphaera sp.]
MYKIIGADLKEYGPVSADELREWIAQGRANGQTAVKLEGTTDWKPLSSFPEFTANLASSPSAAIPPTLPSPADYSSLPSDIAERDYDLDIGGCISRSWSLLTNNFGRIFLGTAIFLLVQFGIGLLGAIPFIGALFSLASLFIMGPLMGGLYYFFLKNIRGQPSEFGDLFAGFRERFVPLMLAYLVTILLTLVSALPGLIVIAIPTFAMVHAQQFDAANFAVALLGFFLTIVPLTYLGTSLIFSIPLIIDKHLDFWPAMQLSRKVVGKHFWTILVLLIVCGLINFAGLCACYVGIFFTMPISFGALMYAYEDIFTQRPAPHG